MTTDKDIIEQPLADRLSDIIGKLAIPPKTVHTYEGNAAEKIALLEKSHPTSDIDVEQIQKDVIAAIVKRDLAEAYASSDQKMKQGILELLNKPYTPY